MAGEVDVMAMFDAMIQAEERAGRFEASSYIEAARDAHAALARERDRLREALEVAASALSGYLPAHRNAITDAAIDKARAALAGEGL